MRGIVNIIIGIVFIVGGLSGGLVLRGTGSGGALAVVGVILIVVGIVRLAKGGGGSGDAPAHPRMRAGGKAVVQSETVVYRERDSKSQGIAKLAPGSEVGIVEASEINDVQWVCVKLIDGQQGYVLGHHLLAR